MATNHRRNTNNNVVQVHHPHMMTAKPQHHRHHAASNRNMELGNTMCGGAQCRYYYDSSSPTFPDLTPPCDMPTPHKSLCRKMPAHHTTTTTTQYMDDPDSIEFCVDDETAKYYKDGRNHHRHKAFDAHHQARWSRNNISATMERFQPIASPSSASVSESSSCTSHTSHTSQNSHHNIDYSYAYYEPGAIMCHSNIPTPDEVAGPSTMPPPNSMRALLLKCKERNQRNSRHTYHGRYGTHENIYEDVSDEKNSRLVSSAQSLNNPDHGCTKKEFQNILSNHYRVLEELNLSVEELLMSSEPPPPVTAEPMLIKRAPTVQSCVVDTLGAQMTAMELKEEHMKATGNEFVVCEDSGFSGSSSGASCSYIGSLRKKKSILTRSLRRSSAPNCANASNGTMYGSCRTVKYPLAASTIDETMAMADAIPMYNSSCGGQTTIKFKNEKSPDSVHKSLKFALWNRRS